VTVELRSEHPLGRGLAARLRARAGRHLRALGREGQALSLLLTGDRAIRALNRRWRGIDRATDVLSFPLDDPPGHGPDLGDVAISIDTAARRARAEGRPLLEEVDRYLVHGILHLCGHDHHRPHQARAMAGEEARLLGRDGMVGSSLPPPTPTPPNLRGRTRSTRFGGLHALPDRRARQGPAHPPGGAPGVALTSIESGRGARRSRASPRTRASGATTRRPRGS
jgi:probable rRNA maturation factor